MSIYGVVYKINSRICTTGIKLLPHVVLQLLGTNISCGGIIVHSKPMFSEAKTC